jgi:hypothetical protein
MICHDGITRTVLLVGRWAIKLPKMRYGYEMFLRGLLANCQERMWWKELRDRRLCPVVCSSRFGVFLIMRRAENVADAPPREEFSGLPLDYKPDNFGLLNGRVVLRDYGS